jgi:hypothetical protein
MVLVQTGDQNKAVYPYARYNPNMQICKIHLYRRRRFNAGT